MPRPSDLYANLGAPGMYQPTPWTPSVLPNVFLIPPVEDGQQVSCIFHSGSASPTAYDPFYGDPRYVQRNPSTPTVTNVAVLDQALSLIQHQASTTSTGGAAYGRRHRWQHAEHVPLSRSSGSPYSTDPSPFGRSPSRAGATAFSNVRFLVENERHSDSQEEQIAPSRPASRRSSVFGERPADYELSSEGPSEDEGEVTGTKKLGGMTLKGRAASALKAIGGAKVKAAENDGRSEARDDANHPQNFLHFDKGSISAAGQKQHKRKTLGQLFGSNSSINVSTTAPEPPSGRSSLTTASNPKLTKRKSINQLFGFSKSSTEDTFEMHDAPASRWDRAAGLRPCSPPPKLSKRKSMTQLFGLGRKAASTTSLAAMGSTSDLDEENSRIAAADARLAALRTLEGPAASKLAYGTQSRKPSLRRSFTAPSVTQLTDVHDAPSTFPHSENSLNRQSSRKSTLQGRPFSFLDLHRHFFHRPSVDQPEIQSSGLSPRPVSPPYQEPTETTNSSLENPPSTDSEPEVEDPVPIFVPRLAVHSPTSSGFLPETNGIVDLSSAIRLDGEGKGDITQWFDALGPDGDSEEGEPSLELGIGLDSLSFEQLSFDPESFVRAA